jgi:hypothetical protein
MTSSKLSAISYLIIALTPAIRTVNQYAKTNHRGAEGAEKDTNKKFNPGGFPPGEKVFSL